MNYRCPVLSTTASVTEQGCGVTEVVMVTQVFLSYELGTYAVTNFVVVDFFPVCGVHRDGNQLFTLEFLARIICIGLRA